MRGKRSTLPLFFLLAAVLFANACGGGGGTTPPPPPPPGGQTAPVSLTMLDAPPAGVTVLSFEVTVNQATLAPGNVNLLTTPVKIEVKELEVEAAFLSTVNVPAGTYNSLAVTLTNPELTILNQTGGTLPGNCANGAVCEYKPAVTGTFTYSGAPFPITIAAGSPTGLLVDLNLNNLITGANTVDFTAAGALVVTQSSAAGGTGQLEELEDIVGKISAVRSANNEFDVQVASDGQTRTLTFQYDSMTQFHDFDKVGCVANNSTCLAVNLLVEVDARLMAGGVLLARKVEVEDEDNDNEEELEGVIVDISGLPASFEMVLVHEHINVAGLEVGNRVQVNVLAPTRFRVDADELPISEQGNPDFDMTSDLMVGQVVEVERQSAVLGTPPAFDTNRIKLKDSRVTGRIASIDTTNNIIVLDTLPRLFGPSPATTLQVRVFPQTRFRSPVTGISGLAVGNTISVRGPLFKNPGGSANPALFAKRIRKR